jgi:8-amino-7-oxononanoate synthase
MNMSYPIDSLLQKKLAEREQSGNLRTLKPENLLADFCSNDYLGLAQHPGLSERTQEIYQTTSRSNGSGGSRLLAGNTQFALDLESWLANLFEAESTLVFPSGYAANSALLSCLPQKGDTVLQDELIHASLREGARLSFAQRFYFRHNDLADLEDKLRHAAGQKFVVAESVYSMDGDFGNLADMLDLCEKYQAQLIWDEAHSTGIWGKNGNGLACEQKQAHRIFARIHTFGKAMGIHGACIAGSRLLMDYLINFARPFIYTTAPDLHSLAAIRAAFEVLQENPDLQMLIRQKIRFFRQEATKYPVLTGKIKDSHSAIQIVQIGGNDLTRQAATALQMAGLDVRAILSPTVKAGEERLRICLHTFNTEAEMENLLRELVVFLEKADEKISKKSRQD